ncbi:MAG: antibiotic biosynthesis monooxygenase [Myxococcales bacterium]|nr:antibiotic biosynthesis monooxygenase [Myxococcales bacterium]
MIVIEGTIRVPDMERARPHMETVITATRAEDGCIHYAFAIDLFDPNLIHISERWSSREALSRHAKSDHIATWRAAGPGLGISDRSLRLYEAEPEPI